MKKIAFILAIVFIILIGGTGLYLYSKGKNPPRPVVFPEVEKTDKIEKEEVYIVKEIRAINKLISDIGLTPDIFPKLDGATASQPIRNLIACAAFNGKCDYWYETEAREMFLNAQFYDSGLSYADQDKVRSKIQDNSKTHDAYLNLIRGKNDLILVSTLPSDDEMAEAKKMGVGLELTPIGLDGFVFVVNKKNKLTNLSTQNIIDIYTKKVISWKDFTGLSAKIVPYTRPVNSGSQELMDKLVMKGAHIDTSFREEKLVFKGMSELIEGVEDNENAIGYSLYYYKNNMIDKRDLRPDVKLIAVDGVEPDAESIASKKYPYVFNIYAVTRISEPKNSPAYQIKEWLTSNEGQGVIEKSGYVPLYRN